MSDRSSPAGEQVDPAFAALTVRYLERRRDDCRVLRARLAARDFDPITACGHRLKGSGASYGFDEVTAIGAVLETAGEAEDERAIGQAIRRLEEFLAAR